MANPAQTAPQDLDDRLDLAVRNTAEVVTEDELRGRFERGDVKGYIGFEPSGKAHIGWKILANKIVDLQQAGVEMTVFLADWHAFINDKLGGDMQAIQECAKYMEGCFFALGLDPDKTTLVWASDLVRSPDYWELVLRIAKATSLARMKRAMDIMGREADEADKDTSKLFYPAMQVADIFYMDLDVAFGGMDQRHAHMLARDVAERVGHAKPVALHTPLVSGLKGGGRMEMLDQKMSKSDPDAAIFLDDAPEAIRAKMEGAYCPAGEVEGNPVLEILQHVVWPETGRLAVERPDKFGGDVAYDAFDDVVADVRDEELHPKDLKAAVGEALVEALAPVRDYFDRNPEYLERFG